MSELQHSAPALNPLTSEGEPFWPPSDGFIAPARLEGTVVLETAIDNTNVVNSRDLASAWTQLSAVSVEAALVGRPDVFDFANNDSLLFAAIRSPVKVAVPDSIEIEKLGLPNYTTIASHDCPIVVDNPVIFTPEFEEERRREHRAKDIHPPTPTDTAPSEKPPQNSQDTPSPQEDMDTLRIMQWKTIGVVYVTMSSIPREVYVGVFILPPYRSRGCGMRACALAVQWAIETIDAHRVQARIMSSPSRESAQRLFTALGFAHEGIQRRAVCDAAGAWADITHMGIVDVDWVVRKRRRAAPRNLWDELFERHQREREELLRWEANESSMRIRRTSSMETVRMEPEPERYFFFSSVSSCADTGTRSPSPTSSTSTASSAASLAPTPSSDRQDHFDFDFDSVSEWRDHHPAPESDAGDRFSDTEWVLGEHGSDPPLSPDEPHSRPLSAASWSSFESVGSAATFSSGRQSLANEWS
ncbi:hypothetical protein K466DRAFT_592762 [Polyporus arcularius HHB13444]|uniref:N-acetyltransferase domain-containing protein n=2 Tax=Polyporaceae TaxID=5317 RepID=A0A5C3NQE1_9APHY|nr:hypothetical protein K466DRAFT_592762 [Polyporus arcularius HHB13444]